jgi:hypothetical protein
MTSHRGRNESGSLIDQWGSEGLENALDDKQNSNLLICFEPKSPLNSLRSPDLALDLALAVVEPARPGEA